MERSAALRAIEDLNEAKNKLNDQMVSAKTPDERKGIIVKGKEVKGKLADLEPKFKNADVKFTELMAKVPTVPSPDTPLGRAMPTMWRFSIGASRKNSIFNQKTISSLARRSTSSISKKGPR